ncbi:unnamed protein product [Protopolystoma xenopodis]|uniref:Uncharacterized protein n=1 Tax=Protopolystoma xenopodis TaxID=117903 RepID=A0A3S4ZCT6_9PLAT|nr:unnamed protein product [Protopolystoma xenopodis]
MPAVSVSLAILSTKLQLVKEKSKVDLLTNFLPKRLCSHSSCSHCPSIYSLPTYLTLALSQHLTLLYSTHEKCALFGEFNMASPAAYLVPPPIRFADLTRVSNSIALMGPYIRF